MRRFIITAAVAAFTLGTAAAYAASGSSGPGSNPEASRNSLGNNMPGSSATEGGSMKDPGGNRATKNRQGSSTSQKTPPSGTTSSGSSGYGNSPSSGGSR